MLAQCSKKIRANAGVLGAQWIASPLPSTSDLRLALCSLFTSSLLSAAAAAVLLIFGSRGSCQQLARSSIRAREHAKAIQISCAAV